MAKKLLQALGHGDAEMALKAIEAYLGSLGVTTAVANAAGQTLTAAAVVGGTILRSGAAAVSDTLPTAALLVAALPNVAAGTTIELVIRNNNSGTLTLVAGSGITLEGTTTIATANARKYAVRFINVTAGSEAVTVSGLMTGAV
jgi:hypothetical protein